jgi:hypothetical protein
VKEELDFEMLNSNIVELIRIKWNLLYYIEVKSEKFAKCLENIKIVFWKLTRHSIS